MLVRTVVAIAIVGNLTPQRRKILGIAEWHYDFAEFWTEPQGFWKSFHSQIQQRPITTIAACGEADWHPMPSSSLC
ncbi:MAG: hypothetical protein WCA35_28370, partial [Kovacikia sp.]